MEVFSRHAPDVLSMSLSVRHADIDKYPAKQHARRVASKLGRSTGLIYLIGQKTRLSEDSDQISPFRQRRYFFYLSGVKEEDCHLTYDIGTDTLLLYVPDFDLKRAIWNGPTLGREEAADKYDVDEVRYYSSLEGDVAEWQYENGEDCPIFVLHRDQVPPTTTATSQLCLDHESLAPATDACRVIKDEHEIKLIQRANDISSAAHTAVLRNIAKMTNETEIHGTFLNTCVNQGAKNQAYEIIAASGANAATLHYVKNDEPLKGRQLVCLDAGAEWDCYASDVTRTFPMSDRWPSREARDIYRVVEEMQEECISRIREGVRYLDLHRLAHRIAIRALKRLGIFREEGSVDEILKSGASSVFFPHGLGHHVGLEVHDVSPESIMAAANGVSGKKEDDEDDGVGGMPTNHDFTGGLSLCSRSAPALKAGMVVTVEPGIYFSRFAIDDAKTKELSKYIRMDVVETYMPVGGVRIEDDILVTKDGYENLTAAAKGDEMLEIIGHRSELVEGKN